MIRRIVLALTLSAATGPVMAQPPARTVPEFLVPPPTLQGVPVQTTDPQGFGGRDRRNRRDGQADGPNGGGPFGRFGGAPGVAGPDQAPVAALPPALPNPALAAQGRGPALKPTGPPAPPADALVVRSLQGSVSAVFDPGSKTARVKLIETDDHGVEGVRTLKPGDVYRDGWRLGGVTATEATLRKGKTLLHVDLRRGWPAPIQPAVLVQPVAPPPAITPPGARRGPIPLTPRAGRGFAGQAANPGLGLSNARAGGSPPPPSPPPPATGPSTITTLQGPNGPMTIQNNPDGSRTMTTVVNGRTMVVNLPGVP